MSDKHFVAVEKHGFMAKLVARVVTREIQMSFCKPVFLPKFVPQSLRATVC